ncbi:MAG: alginate lyase family protein [Sphingomonas sp.]
MAVDRRMILAGGAALAAFPASARSDRLDIATIDRHRILRAASRYLVERPITITAYPAERSPGTRHDYYSEGDYWWPDLADPRGPYVRRDGYSNPARFDAHRQALIRLSVQVPALVAAWRVTGDLRFARHAERHLDAWFATPATRMAPHLNHAQAIIGINTGRGIGVIDTLHLVEVARAIAVIDGVAPRRFRLKHGDAIRGWFRAYLTWLTTSGNGTDERDEENNHGSCWALQAAEFARLVGDRQVRAFVRDRFRTRLIPDQIAPDGRQQLELARTKPYSYSLFNLDVLAALAHIASDEGDLWRFATPDGRSLAGALAFMVPYIADKSRWPYKPDVEYFDALPVRQVALLFGGQALGRPDYLALWKRLNPDPQVPEIIRNFPLRQPLLWTV